MVKQPDERSLSEIDFCEIVTLAVGGFAKVSLVTLKSTGSAYALKTIARDELTSEVSIKTLFSELNIHKEIDHVFITKLLGAFTSTSSVHFLLSYEAGGDLCTLMNEKEGCKFSVKEAQFYLAELTLALGYLHQKKICHKDVKLLNILIAADGHIRLADFGLSCRKKRFFKMKKVASTPLYTAPEIYMLQNFGFEVDWWAFGVTAYNLLTGRCPFYDNSRAKLMKQVLEDPPAMDDVPEAARSFITGLLMKKPKQRLGTHGVTEICQHEFFKEINFDKMHAKGYEPPFLPELSGPMDHSRFNRKKKQRQNRGQQLRPTYMTDLQIKLELTTFYYRGNCIP